MYKLQHVTKDILALSESDRRLSRFENIFPLPHGVSYNNYVILDDKTVLMDTADRSVADQFLENLRAALSGRPLDYLVVQHVEPDHAAMIGTVLSIFPEVTVVASKQAHMMIRQFFPGMAIPNTVEIKEGDTLELGSHTLHFVSAPMVHWPEVMVTYDDLDKVLFSADGFGSFGVVDGSIFADEHDFEKEYLDDARRYYANIVGKFGAQVQNLLKKAASLEISAICPLHGPVWRENLGWFIGKYQTWSAYTPETDDILVVYCSLYGHTESAALAAAAKLRAVSGKNVAVYDASETDTSFLISEVWRCAKVVLFCPTYNMGIYPKMETFLNDMAALLVQNRIFALAENGTWAPAAGKLMREKVSALKNVSVLEPTFTIRSAISEKDEARLDEFVEMIANA